MSERSPGPHRRHMWIERAQTHDMREMLDREVSFTTVDPQE
jgi:hypothetical protein